MLRHSLDTIHNLQDGGCLCSKAVILNDFQALLLKFKAKLHQMTTIFEILYPRTSVEGEIFLDLSFPLMHVSLCQIIDNKACFVIVFL